jgi:Tfp pilus assembly protein PilN
MRAVNLIPDDQRSGVSLGAGRSEGTAYAVVVLLGGLAVLAFLYGSARHQISSRTAQAASITAEVSQVQSQAAALAPYASFITLREQRAAAVAELVNTRFDWSHGLHELGRVLPKGVWLTSIAGSAAAAATSAAATAAATPAAAAGTVTSATPPGSIPTLNVTGCAADQAHVALALDRLRLIDGVSAVTLQASGGTIAGAVAAAGCKTSFTAVLTFEPLPNSATVDSATAPAGKTSTAAATSTGTGTGAG